MLRTIFSIGFAQVVGLLINTVRAKIFAVLLGPAGFGVVATIDQLVVSVSQFSNLSLPFTALKFLSRGHSLGEEQFRKSYAAFLQAIAILAVIATLIAIAVIPRNLANLDPQIAKYRQPVLIALLGIPATMLLVFFGNVLAARQKTIQSVLLTRLSSLVLMVFGGIGCLFGGISGIYLVSVPASTALVVGMVIFARVKMNWPLRDRPAALGRKLKANSEIVETAISTYIAVCSYSGLLLLARYQSITHLSEEAAGLLQAGLATAMSVGAVLEPTNMLYFAPYVNRAIPAPEKIEVASKFLPRLIFVYCLGALPVLLFPELVLRILFSNRFIPAAPLLPWFIAWQCLYQISNVYQQLLIGLDDLRGYGAVTTLGNLCAAALCILWTGLFGLIGTAAAFVVGAIITAGLTVIRLHSRHKLSVPKSMTAIVAFPVLGFALVAALGHLTTEMTLTGVGARLLTAVVLLAGLCFVLPKALRFDLVAGMTAGVRALTRWIAPPNS
jgi:O-antigen/teichoic acid export membrane protein